MQPTYSCLESHGQRSLEGCIVHGIAKKLDMTEHPCPQLVFLPMLKTQVIPYWDINIWMSAGVQPRLIQGIRSGDGVGDLFIYKYLSKI